MIIVRLLPADDIAILALRRRRITGCKSNHTKSLVLQDVVIVIPALAGFDLVTEVVEGLTLHIAELLLVKRHEVWTNGLASVAELFGGVGGFGALDKAVVFRHLSSEALVLLVSGAALLFDSWVGGRCSDGRVACEHAAGRGPVVDRGRVVFGDEAHCRVVLAVVGRVLDCFAVAIELLRIGVSHVRSRCSRTVLDGPW